VTKIKNDSKRVLKGFWGLLTKVQRIAEKNLKDCGKELKGLRKRT
jgi:hypothetical protein